MLTLMGDCVNVAWPSDVHGESGYLWCVASSIGVVSGMVGGTGSNRSACGWSEVNSVRTVLPIAPIQTRR